MKAYFQTRRPLRLAAAALALVLVLLCSGCTGAAWLGLSWGRAAGGEGRQITLYGEQHSVQGILDRELELWSQAYHEQGQRSLFVELPYYSAQYLNLWMQAEDDAILDQLFADSAGTAGGTEAVKRFYQAIKRDAPETVFYGTDIGHQYWSTGQRYLDELRAQGRAASPEYRRAEQVMRQGAAFYTGQSEDLSLDYLAAHAAPDSARGWAKRENWMVENFCWAFEQLEDPRAVGIYGSAHTALGGTAYGTPALPNMASQLRTRYGAGAVHSEDLTAYAKRIDPLAVEALTVGGREYAAAYFGEEDLSGWNDSFQSRRFWRLEDAYRDFQDAPLTGDVLPYDNYPVRVEAGQVFAIEYTRRDGTALWLCYRADGHTWQGKEATEGIQVEAVGR